MPEAPDPLASTSFPPSLPQPFPLSFAPPPPPPAFASAPAPRLTTRLPHFGHLLLLLVLLVLSLTVCGAAGVFAFHRHDMLAAAQDKRLGLFLNIAAYAVTLLVAWAAFPLLWRRPFLAGIRWNAAALRPRLIGLGILVSIASEAISAVLPHPKDMPIEELFRNHALIWIIVVFGTLVAPVFEELVFRGFLLPALAIAVDYARLPRAGAPADDLRTHFEWSTSEAFSPLALAISSVLTSILFALIHAKQLANNWPAVALLFCVSLVLCAVRIHLRSLAASTLVHATYNGFIFVTLAIATRGFTHLDKI